MAKKTGNPFLDMDYPRFMEFGKFEMPDFGKFTEQFKVPGMDGASLIESQRKNIEAIAAANRVAFEGAQALLQRQTEILRQAVDETTRAMQQIASAGTPEDKLAKQAELAKEAFELAIANVRELAEMGAKSNSEAVELLNQRVSESLEELRAAIKKVAA